MIDLIRTRLQFYTKTESLIDAIARFKTGIKLEEKPNVAYCAKRSSAPNQYVHAVKYLLCLILSFLRRMIRNCECEERGIGEVQKCLDSLCQNNKVREHSTSKMHTEEEACECIYFSKNTPEKYSKVCGANEALKDCSNSEIGNSKCLTDSLCLTTTATDSGLVLSVTSDASQDVLKIQESRVHLLVQSSTSNSEKHNTEIKSASEEEQTGLRNAPNNPSSKDHDEERDSKHSSSIASTSTRINLHGVYQTEGGEENQLDLDSLTNADNESIGIASLEIDDTFCWQETDDVVASTRANQKFENKLKEIFHSANLVNQYGTAETPSFSQFADTLSNDSDKPIQNNSLVYSEKFPRVQEVVQVNTALADSLLKKDGNTAELKNRELTLKKDKLTRDAACVVNSTVDDHLVRKKKQFLENATASNMFSDLYNVGTNNISADKTSPNTFTNFCLENTMIMYDAMKSNDAQSLSTNPTTKDEYNDEPDVASLKDIQVEGYPNEGMGDQQEAEGVDSLAQTADAGEGENVAREEGEAESFGETEEENQETGGGQGGGGSDYGGEGGEEEGKDGEGNDYIIMMMRGALGPAVDEAVLDTMDVIKRLGGLVGKGGGGGGESTQSRSEKSGEQKGGTQESSAKPESGGEQGSGAVDPEEEEEREVANENLDEE